MPAVNSNSVVMHRNVQDNNADTASLLTVSVWMNGILQIKMQLFIRWNICYQAEINLAYKKNLIYSCLIMQAALDACALYLRNANASLCRETKHLHLKRLLWSTTSSYEAALRAMKHGWRRVKQSLFRLHIFCPKFGHKTLLKSMNLFAKICQSGFSGKYDTWRNTQKRNITILNL